MKKAYADAYTRSFLLSVNYTVPASAYAVVTSLSATVEVTYFEENETILAASFAGENAMVEVYENDI